MGFWSGLGKVLLKAAPIAAGFIPGVGPLASLAIGGLAGGASKKLSGGSWKDALIGGGLGAAEGYGGSMLSKGLGPSEGILGKIKAGGKLAMGGGPEGSGKLGSIMDIAKMGLGALSQGGQGQMGMQNGGMMNSSPIGPSPNAGPNIMDAITRGKLAAQGARPTRFVA